MNQRPPFLKSLKMLIEVIAPPQPGEEQSAQFRGVRLEDVLQRYHDRYGAERTANLVEHLMTRLSSFHWVRPQEWKQMMNVRVIEEFIKEVEEDLAGSEG